MRKLFLTSIALLLAIATGSAARTFSHPGLVVTTASIERMRGYINGGEPNVMASYEALKACNLSKADYRMAGPYSVIARDGTYARTKGGSERDFCAAFYNALLWALDGDEAHALAAERIVRAYADSLRGVSGHDAPLCCLQGFYLVNAMELLRSRASESEIGRWKAMLQRTFVPVIDAFEAASPYANGNWGAIVNKLRMAIAVFCDDEAMYEKSKTMMLDCNDNSALPYYIAANGQCQETGRDQGHAQLGIGNLAEACEMAWSQGDDLWGALANRMLAGYEYAARYNLGYDVPFSQWTDRTGLYNDWEVPGAMGRGKFPCIYELAYAHFAGRRGLAMPYTAQVLGKAGGVRPETRTGNCDAIGLGTLLFYQGTNVDHKTRKPRMKPYKKLHQAFTYPAPEGVPLMRDYDVFVLPRGQKVWTRIDTYMAKVNAADSLNTLTGHSVSKLSYAFFDFTGDVFVRVVTRGRTFSTARVRPDYRGVIANTVNDSTMQFLLFQPENVSVEFDGDRRHNLLLFTSKPPQTVDEALVAAKRAGRGFEYYKPGLYTQDSIVARSNTTYYLAPGAYFTGTWRVEDCDNVSILGRGVARPASGYEGAHVWRSRNVLIDGLIVNTCPIGSSDGVTFHDVRSISHPQWGDGLNVFASSNVLYDRVFCRNSDDCTTVYATRKGFSGSAHNIRMRNSTLWADVAHPIMIGLHGSPEQRDSITDLTYENIDILCQTENQTDYQGAMAINCGDNNSVRRVTFDNVRVEQIERGALFHVKVCYNDKYGLAPGGPVEDILFRNIRYYGAPPTSLSIITGYDQDRAVRRLTFENLRINGVPVTDTMERKPRWYHASDYVPCYVGPHVEGLTFK